LSLRVKSSVEEVLAKVNAKVVKVLAAIAKYHPLFEKLMHIVDYGKDETVSARLNDAHLL